jgi:hypothetical protein
MQHVLACGCYLQQSDLVRLEDQDFEGEVTLVHVIFARRHCAEAYKLVYLTLVAVGKPKDI